MKLLVFSDSHSALSFMRKAILAQKPDAIAHLGDYYDDGQVIAEENFHIPVYQVVGNCDTFRAPHDALSQMYLPIGGVMTLMVHGHTYRVKSGTGALTAEGRRRGAGLVLYGHTHIADCHEEDGMYVLNPGPAGYGGSCGVVELENGEVKSCRILQEREL